METDWPCLLPIPLLTLVGVATIKIPIYEIKIKLKHSKFSVLINGKTYLHGKVQLDFFLARLHFKGIFFNLVNLSKEGFVY